MSDFERFYEAMMVEEIEKECFVRKWSGEADIFVWVLRQKKVTIPAIRDALAKVYPHFANKTTGAVSSRLRHYKEGDYDLKAISDEDKAAGLQKAKDFLGDV